MSDAGSKAVQLTVGKLIALALSMFVFAYWLMPPLYDLFCEVTGLNNKVVFEQSDAVEAKVDTDRLVRVKFISTKKAGMPWAFKPADFVLDVHPGEAISTHFIAQNPTGDYMVGQAVPSLVPVNAATYFHKTECFCFNSQVLAPGETADLGLRFVVDQSIPKAVNSITLSYTLYDVTETSSDKIDQIKNNSESSLDELAVLSF